MTRLAARCTVFHVKPLKRRARRSLLVAHVSVSVSWLGLTVGLLTLGITAFTTRDPATEQAAIRARVQAWALSRGPR